MRLSYALLATALVAGTGSTIAQTTAVTPPIYENHSMMIVGPLPAEVVPAFLKSHFDVAQRLPDGSFRVVATAADKERLVSEYAAVVEVENLEDFYRMGLVAGEAQGGYHTYDETNGELFFASFHPLAHLDTAGYSLEGRPICVLKISDNVEIDEDEPEILINGLIHAREPIGIEIILYFMYYLLDNYALDSEIQALVDNAEIWLMPICNPDGYFYNELASPGGGGMWRKNRRNNGDGSYGIDLNRNWGFLWGYDDFGSSPEPPDETFRGTAAFSEPETQVMREFINAHDFSVIVNYHAFGDVYLKPWSFLRGLYGPDDRIFLFEMDTLHAYNGYSIEQSFYPVNGGACDWQYGEQYEKKKAVCYVPEVGPWFWPAASEIEPLCTENLPANLFFVREAIRLWDHPTRSLATSFMYFDTTVDACSEGFSRTAEFFNFHGDRSFRVDVDYFDSTASGWFTGNPFSTVLLPGSDLSVTLEFEPRSAENLSEGENSLAGHFSLVLSTLDGSPVVDTLFFPIMMTLDLVDADADGIGDDCDNCILAYNPEQADTDGDGDGNACDTDDDDDGVADGEDNCPLAANAGQSDDDADGLGNACDNCPNDYNPGQEDHDNDFIGDACCCFVSRGNVNDDPDDKVNVSDVSYLVDFLFGAPTGPSPLCWKEGNANGDPDEKVNVSDVSYLIAYLFGIPTGPAPPACP
ncbi:MAG: M14 family metallopeptidase [candidate division Zixibacteria bacterium]|nr:M14 family metallopeptidase [candidate division Zixibacteria bacterium]